MNILILDDHPTNRKLLRATLEAEEFTVFEAANGLEGLDVLKEEEIHIIVSDILMPKMDGYKFCHEVRNDKRFDQVPFIFYTATYTSPSDEKFALDLGGDAFIRKPAAAKVMVGLLREALQKPRQRPRRVKPLAEQEVLHEYSERLVAKLEQKNVELAETTEKLVHSEKRFRALVEKSAEGISLLDSTGTVLYQSPQVTRILGYKPEERLGRSGFELVHPEDLKSAQTLFAELLRRPGSTTRIEVRAKHKNGSWRWIDATVTDLLAEPGVEAIVVNYRDITERKNAEDRLRKLSRAAEQTADNIVITDKDGIIEYVNPAFEKLTGYNGIDIIGKTPRILKSGKHDKAFYEDLWRTVLSGETFRAIFTNRKKSGERYFEEQTITPLCDVKGNITHFVSCGKDVTEQQKAEEALRASERQLSLVYTNVSDIIFYLAVEPEDRYRFISVNQAFLKATGVAPSQVVGKLVQEVIPKPSLDLVLAKYKEAIQGNTTVTWEETSVYPTGTKHGEVSVTPIFDSDGRCTNLIGAVHDITERKQAEAALRKSEENYRQLFENALTGVFVAKPDGTVVECNPAFVKMFGFRLSEEARKTNMMKVWSSPDARKKMFDLLVKDGKVDHFEAEMRKADGSPLNVVGNVIGKFDSQGRLVELQGYIFDDTSRRRLEAQFLRTQRMESIGTLAGGIAHDLNNVLGPIAMAIAMLKHMVTDERGQRMLSTLESSAFRGAALVKQVLTFARGVEGERVEVQLKHLIGEIQKIAKETFPKSIRVETSVPGDLWTVIGDATQLHQVLMNFCVNARDAMPHGGRLLIEAENVSLDEQYARMHIEAKAGPYVVFSVSDTGTGILPGLIDRVFEPFFTTKETGKGTGLGLATVSTVVKSHGGFVNVYSEMGKGSVFKVCIPASGTSGAGEVTKKEAAIIPGNGEMILIVDDEASIREITKETLETWGYKTLEAGDGAEGVAVYATRSKEIAAVITDMMMPFMEGTATIRAIHKINPKAKILAVSGFPNQEAFDEASRSVVKAVLQKPYSAEKLLSTLHDVLHEAGESR